MISESSALQIVEPHFPTLQGVILGAWEDYKNYDPAHRRVHGTTCRANVVHDHMKHRARAAFGETPNAAVVEIQRLFLIVLEQKIAIRLKLLNIEKNSSNIPTAQNKAFLAQEELVGVEPCCHLEAGYILDSLGTDITEIWLTCPSGPKSRAWEVCIYRATDENQVDRINVERISKGTKTKVAAKPQRDTGQDDDVGNA